jgi:hypothetical protein
MPMMTAALILLLGWSLFAFGAVYDWALAPVVLLATIGGLATVISRRHHRAWLDLWLLIVATVAVLQLVPVPSAIRDLLSPNQSAYLARVSLALPAGDVWRPLSLYPGAWLFGAGACLAAIATFVWARDALESRGVRRLSRSVAWMGLAASVLVVIQPTMFGDHLVYGFWAPIGEGARPMGPIISRNHMAAWIVLAWPLTVGYLFAHGRTHWQNRRVARSVLVLSDMRALWLVLAAALMVAALLVTQSRAGVIGFAVAGLALVAQVWSRTGPAGRVGMVGFLVVVTTTVSLWASPDAVLMRFENAMSGLDGGRPEIWSQTLTLIRAYPVAGIGLGTFDVVMPAYQTGSFATLLNHAHNQYLHVLAEGGWLLAAPLTAAAVTFGFTAWRRLRQDQTAVVHLRQGALAGLVGLATLSIFEVPMLTPAVMLLAAVSAAIVVRRPETDRDEEPTP